MKFLMAILLTALLSFATALYFPWWIIAAVAFIVAAIIPQKPSMAFLSGALALFFLWGIQSFIIDLNNNHILATKIADLITHQPSAILIILITAVVGALVAGFAAVTGSLAREIFFSRKKAVSYKNA